MLVIFKSKPDMFDKERRGGKPNTLRKIDREDLRFQKLERKEHGWDNEPTHICIENSSTGEHFIRRITDVTTYEGWMIISWDTDTLEEAP